jgi:uncharacterized protein (DUF2236 family)
VGRSVTADGLERLRSAVQIQMRRSMGMGGKPPPAACTDPAEAFFPPGSITRHVNGDLPAMLIGGIAALLLQTLHPLTMAGVDRHSNYRENPLGRLERTARFLGTTTFGTRAEAEEAMAWVRSVHAAVNGVAPDGRLYSAEDPALITWVHAAEMHCFLTSSVIYGPRPLSPDEQDRYLDEMARVALGLGAVEVPRNRAELDAYFAAVRPELALTKEARTARNFVRRGVARWPHEITTYAILVAAAQGVLPPWARQQLRMPAVPAADRLAVRPAARALGAALRWVVTGPTVDRTVDPTDPSDDDLLVSAG